MISCGLSEGGGGGSGAQNGATYYINWEQRFDGDGFGFSPVCANLAGDGIGEGNLIGSFIEISMVITPFTFCYPTYLLIQE